MAITASRIMIDDLADKSAEEIMALMLIAYTTALGCTQLNEADAERGYLSFAEMMFDIGRRLGGVDKLEIARHVAHYRMASGAKGKPQ